MRRFLVGTEPMGDFVCKKEPIKQGRLMPGNQSELDFKLYGETLTEEISSLLKELNQKTL